MKKRHIILSAIVLLVITGVKSRALKALGSHRLSRKPNNPIIRR